MNNLTKHLLLIATFLMATTDLSLSNQATEPSVKPSVLAKISKISTRSKIAAAAISAIVLTTLAGYVGLKREGSCLESINDKVYAKKYLYGWAKTFGEEIQALDEYNRFRWALDLIAKKCSRFAKTLKKGSDAQKNVTLVADQARAMYKKFHRTAFLSEEFYYSNEVKREGMLDSQLFNEDLVKLLTLYCQARDAYEELAKSSPDFKIKDLNEISGLDFNEKLDPDGELGFYGEHPFNIIYRSKIFNIVEGRIFDMKTLLTNPYMLFFNPTYCYNQ